MFAQFLLYTSVWESMLYIIETCIFNSVPEKESVSMVFDLNEMNTGLFHHFSLRKLSSIPVDLFWLMLMNVAVKRGLFVSAEYLLYMFPIKQMFVCNIFFLQRHVLTLQRVKHRKSIDFQIQTSSEDSISKFFFKYYIK